MNNKMVAMAVLDFVWVVTSYAALLALIAIMGVILFKVGITSFKLAMNAVGATRGIENIRGIAKQPYHGTTGKKDEIELMVSDISKLIQIGIESNRYAKYTYDLFRVELIISNIDYLINLIDSKLEKIDYEKYMYELFKVEKVRSNIDSLKSFAESRREKNFARYAYIQLFKK